MSEKVYKIYATTSILLLIVFFLSPLKDNIREWRSYQNSFNKLLAELPQKEKPVPKKLGQIWVPELDRIDRCITCHLGSDNDKLANAPLPFSSHPKMYHNINKFGCTICHDGQGLAVDYVDAHLPGEFWDRPVRPNRYTESACGFCHINENLKETPNLNSGKILVRELKCVGCHELPEDYGFFSPALDGISNKIITRNWLVKWLKNPKLLKPETRMPNFSLSDQEIESLTDFLMGLKTYPKNPPLEPLPEIYHQKKDEEKFIQSGKTLFREAFCISCHPVAGEGGKIATDLAGLASKAKDIWIFNYIKNPRLFQPEVEMPRYNYSTKEIAALTAYIGAEFIDWQKQNEENTISDTLIHSAELGGAVFIKYNCVGCHQISDLKIESNPGQSLREIGSKKMYQIFFAETSIPHTLYDFIETNLRDPRIFGKTMRMPDYGLTEKKIQSITTYLLSLNKNNLPKDYIRKNPLKARFFPPGKSGTIMKKYSCLRCHSLNGTGGTIAPDLSFAGSKFNPDWLKQFFKDP